MTEVTQLSPEVLKAIDVWIAKYPAEQRQSAVIPALHITQDAYTATYSDINASVFGVK